MLGSHLCLIAVTTRSTLTAGLNSMSRWNAPFLSATGTVRGYPSICHTFLDKTTILVDAIESCDSLGLDFDTVLSNTNTSYNPDERGRSSGRSGADVERILAFNTIGRVDPVEYVDDWTSVLEYALSQESQGSGSE